MAGIQVDVEALKAKSAEIQEMDVVLDAQSGSKAAGKRSVQNKLIAENAEDKFIQSVIDNLRKKFEGDALYATVLALSSQVDDEFSDEIDQRVDEIVESQKTEDVEKLSDEQVAELQETRKEKVKEFKALANILEMFGQDISSVPEPKVRRGSRGPRGPRTLSKFQYQVNETVLDPEVNSLATVAKLSGGVKVGELKKHIEAQGIDLKNPPAEWTAELPHDVGTLTATALPEYADDFAEEEDENEAA